LGDHPIIADARGPSGHCLSYDDASVVLSGTVFSRIYFGPPNYGETPAEDAREDATLLLLDAPICVNAASRPDSGAPFVRDLILVQLAAAHIEPNVLIHARGRRATVRGSLYPALTGHHRTSVVLDVYSVTVP
jgi:hypothetical protein